MRDVVAGREVDAVERLEEYPRLAQVRRDFFHVDARGAGKAVGESALVVADVRVIEAGVALEHGVAGDVPVLRQRNGEHGVPHRAAFAQRLAAAARPFDVAAREARA